MPGIIPFIPLIATVLGGAGAMVDQNVQNKNTLKQNQDAQAAAVQNTKANGAQAVTNLGGITSGTPNVSLGGGTALTPSKPGTPATAPTTAPPTSAAPAASGQPNAATAQALAANPQLAQMLQTLTPQQKQMLQQVVTQQGGGAGASPTANI